MARTGTTRARVTAGTRSAARGREGDGFPRDAQRAAIVSSALEMLDESGLEDFSMRKLAARLSMSVGNLYVYFEDRDELLDGVRDAVLGAITAEPITDAADWQTAVKRVMHHYRDELRAHPGARVLLQRTTSIVPGMWQLGQILTEILQGAGIADPAQVVLYNRILVWTLSGFVAQEDALAHRTVQGEPGPGKRARRTLILSPATMELITSQPEAMRQSADIDVDELFEATLDAVITGIAAMAAPARVAKQRSRKSSDRRGARR